jgi:hypothetical protein
MKTSILSEYIPASWFDEKGIYKVRARILERSPDVNGCLFMTLTVDPSRYSGPDVAHDHAKDKIRRVFQRFRDGVNHKGKKYKFDAPYCWKLEFHKNGWPHFHIIFLSRRKFLPPDLLKRVWNLGRTDVGRIVTDEFDYLLKYVSKNPDLPDWILDRSNLRIFQTSRGFYKPIPKAPNKPIRKSKTKKKNVSRTIRERLSKWSHMGKLVSEDKSHVEVLHFPVPLKEIFTHLIVDIAREGRYLGKRKVIIKTSHQKSAWIQKAWEIARNRDYSSPEWSLSVPPLSTNEKTEKVRLYSLKRKLQPHPGT